MEFSLKTIIDLLNKKSISADGYEIICGDTINTRISSTGDGVKIIFDSPFIYVVIKQLGKINIFDIKRKINSITISYEKITIDIDDFPDITKPNPLSEK
jgi:hypothetical protein